MPDPDLSRTETGERTVFVPLTTPIVSFMAENAGLLGARAEASRRLASVASVRIRSLESSDA